ncbi:MAG: PIN domain-containing protein [Treponema sp.]|jgi:predicted nucleic acid-binding protein|nr:PIN domain-containing protein [Treponema sp.]
MPVKKAVLDTNVLVSALWNPLGTPARIISLMPLGLLIPCYDFRCLKEYRDVLNRPKFKFSGEKTALLLREIERYGISITALPSAVPFTDEADRKFYETAKTAGAVLITGNKRHYPNGNLRGKAAPSRFSIASPSEIAKEWRIG